MKSSASRGATRFHIACVCGCPCKGGPAATPPVTHADRRLPVSMKSSSKPSNTGGRKVVMTMRRWATWLLVGGLAALGSVALADALRGDPTTRQAAAPTISVALIPRNEPAASAMSRRPLLQRGKRRVPARRHPPARLENAPPPKLRSCRFSISPTGENALPGSAAWSRDGRFFARELGGVVEFNSIASESESSCAVTPLHSNRTGLSRTRVGTTSSSVHARSRSHPAGRSSRASAIGRFSSSRGSPTAGWR